MGRQTYIQPNRQTDQQITDRQIDKWVEISTDRQPNIYTDQHIDKRIGRKTDR